MLRISLDALQVLDAIARCGSFAAAGEVLHRTTSTMSYTVRKLEGDLGVKVFDRSGHRATLTEAGRLLLDEGRAILDAAQSVERRVREALK
jgi:DNA-binding transcriptional LysR family regulator